MMEFNLAPAAQHVVYVALVWIGFGTLAGMLAVFILPVRQPSGPVATLLLGIVGSVLGLWGLTWLYQGKALNPISPLGFFAATAGAFLLLILLRAGQACFHRANQDEDTSES